MKYKDLFNTYEEAADLHPEITETVKAESELNELLHTLDADMMQRLDTLAGNLARAYEMQGFLFGLNCERVHG